MAELPVSVLPTVPTATPPRLDRGGAVGGSQRIPVRRADMDAWGFPVTPYPQQVAFATELQTVFDSGLVGVFESPTGTGKSLSIICGSLSWLAARRRADAAPSSSGPEHSPLQDHALLDWVDAFDPTALQQTTNNGTKKKRRARNRTHSHDRQLPDSAVPAMRTQTSKISYLDDEYLLLKEISDVRPSRNIPGTNRKRRASSIDSDADSIGDPHKTQFHRDDIAPILATPRVYYCSRTHTQLSQFVNEIKRTQFSRETDPPFPSSFTNKVGSPAKLMVTAFASRKLLCLNPKVNSLPSASAVNDRCAELMDKQTTSKKAGCPFYSREKILDLADVAVDRILDVEDLVTEGKRHSTCPYYAAREALTNGPDIAVLPYAALIHQPTRESLGVVLDENSVVVFDEAHNLIDAVNDMHSVVVHSNILSTAAQALGQYINRYSGRLSSTNLYFANQLSVVLRSLEKSLVSMNDCVSTVGAFTFEAGIDNVNLFKLVTFMKESHLSRKLMGFMESLAKDSPDGQKSRRSDMHSVESLLTALTNPVGDGRIIVSSGRSLKFMMLNPAVHFDTIVQAAKAVVLAGGTMAPRSSVVGRLLMGTPKNKVYDFSCGHVVSPGNITALALGTGPMGVDFNFTFDSKSQHQTIDQLGRAVINISRIVPKGVVVFFPSYAYEESVFGRWQESNLLSTLAAQKQICRESRGVGAESVLEEYKTITTECKSGALLSAVIGGKLSEGINFADDLGRCVIIVGMPYPNLMDPEVREMRSYIERSAGKAIADEFLEDSCMKAVNQSIGRVIRHADDHAAILLVDKRYSRPKVVSKLPSWIQPSYSATPSFGKAISMLSSFFKKQRSGN